jgi:antitoxin component of RelBE/YafQ-DinJ toxin-antitoxin module
MYYFCNIFVCMRTVLQIPINPSLKSAASQVAMDMGFSSLQETVRVMLTKLARGQIHLSFEENIVPLSFKNEVKYMEMDNDFKNGKNIYKVSNVKALMKQLNED